MLKHCAIVFAVGAILAVLLTGCGPKEAEAGVKTEPAKPLVFWVENQTRNKISEVVITGAEMPMSFGTIRPDQDEDLKHGALTAPRHAEVHWTEPGQGRFWRPIKMARYYSDGYSGPIRFVIHQDRTVSVQLD
ncbi:hypothetical protein [Mucisphaera calidilacus]|uniref:FHA domain-containing protein n=1 Tax=Mucisphaera calidilacus TaxID=2527982 RepID=A0A518BTB2_9BACT|nr:hypothetical protein [Mucisphaera calidilacus]QDU70210.1 hypothetical protein Pan265_00320 [Mucisphaera calidilacus]